MPFYLLLVATTIVTAAGYIAVLGRPLLMVNLNFNSADISSVLAVSGAISVPFPFLIGWLSDRIGRYGLLALCYLATVLSLALFAASTSLWQFWVAAIVGTIAGASSAVGPALVADLVSRESLGVALARFGATNWVGGVIGFAGAGYAIQALGITNSVVMAGGLSLFAVILLFRVRQTRRLALA